MPTIGDAARRLDDMASALAGDSLRGVTGRVASAARLDVLASVERSLPGRRFSGWKRAGQLTARYKVLSDSTATISAAPRGPWVVLSTGRIAGRRATRRGRRKVATWGPTRGKGTWATARRTIVQLTPDRIAAEARKALLQ